MGVVTCNASQRCFRIYVLRYVGVQIVCWIFIDTYNTREPYQYL